MRVDELVHQPQPQTEAAMAAGRRAIRLTKALEDVRQKLRRDSRAGVRHVEFAQAVGRLHAHGYLSTSIGELDGIGQEIADDLMKAVGIREDRAFPGAANEIVGPFR